MTKNEWKYQIMISYAEDSSRIAGRAAIVTVRRAAQS